MAYSVIIDAIKMVNFGTVLKHSFKNVIKILNILNRGVSFSSTRWYRTPKWFPFLVTSLKILWIKFYIGTFERTHGGSPSNLQQPTIKRILFRWIIHEIGANIMHSTFISISERYTKTRHVRLPFWTSPIHWTL